MKQAFILLLFVLGTAASRAQALKGSAWLLKNIDNIESGKSQPIDATVKVSLSFDTDSTYSGEVCNKFTGTYSTVNDKSITVKKASHAPTATCLGVGTLQTQVLDVFAKATRYKVDKDKLFVFTSDDHRLIFQKK